MSYNRSHTAVHYSMAEFAWILFFLAIGASVVLYTAYMNIQKENRSLIEQNRKLTREVDSLTLRLAEKENAVMPCWKRPESPIPAIAGTIFIDNTRQIRVKHFKGKETVIAAGREDNNFSLSLKLKLVLTNQYKWEREYAAAQNCYLRMKIVNNTERYSLYQEAAEVLNDLGIVVVQE